MRLLLTSDLHLTPRPEHAYRLEYLNWIARKCTEEYIDSVAICGDLTDAKDRHPAWFVNSICDSLALITSQIGGGHLHVLAGNHDGPSKDECFWAFLRHIEGIKHYTRPAATPDAHCTLLFAPFGTEHEVISKLENLPTDRYYIVLMHTSVDNALVENGTRLANPNMPSRFIPEKFRGVPFGEKGSMVVYSGDIHVPQEVGDITYIGAPYHTRFGDQFTPRTLILDTVEQCVETLRYEEAPQLLTMRIEVPNMNQVIHFLQTHARPGDYVKLVGKGDRDLLPQDWKAFTKEVAQLLEENGVLLKGTELQIVRVDSTAIRAPSGRRSDVAIARTYAHQQGFNEETTEAGLAIIDSSPKGNT